MMRELKKYYYLGPVVLFGRVVQDNWEGETVASSSAKAKNNLKYQWKKENDYLASAGPVQLPNEVSVIFDY